MSYSYRIGGLFPRVQSGPKKGEPNIIFSSSLDYDKATQTLRSRDDLGHLEADLKITSESVKVPGIDRFIRDWLLDGYDSPPRGIGGLTDKKSPQSLFNQYVGAILNQWTTTPLNQLMKLLEVVGYSGAGHEMAGDTSERFTQVGSQDDPIYRDASEMATDGTYLNYRPTEKWEKYMNRIETEKGIAVHSSYDLESLRKNLDAMQAHQDHDHSSMDEQEASPPLWYPSLLYTYGSTSKRDQSLKRTNLPGPVLMMQPGEELILNFDNSIRLPGLTDQQNALAGFVPNSTYGAGGSEGLGAGTSTNIHVHGAHTTSGGFGDNVVSRYTTGQSWTSSFSIPEEHGQGAYWYHPHYHPSVNQQVYGGLSGSLTIGDPLAKLPGFEDTPRNLAVLKTLDFEVDRKGHLLASSYGSLGGPLTNQLRMASVNGEFKPTAEGDAGGWQSITLSNQSNQFFYNIRLHHGDPQDPTVLPIWIYGEDGHQYPKVRRAMGALGGNKSKQPTAYSQARDLIALAPGKRVDVLAYLPPGTTQLSSIYNFKADDDKFQITNMGGYPELVEHTEKSRQESSASAGALALFAASDSTPVLTAKQQKDAIRQLNQDIEIQRVRPTTKPEDYDSDRLPSVNLFEQDSNGTDLWYPARKRQFSWAKNTLVGKPEEWDPATQLELERQDRGYKRFRPLVDLSKKGGGLLSVDGEIKQDWLGYDQPFLINDHVFPNAPLVVSQLGTIEEWELLNWSLSFPWKYVGHPFHIHINDYQVKDADTELDGKRSLEDVTMLNSSGYRYRDTSVNDESEAIVDQPSVQGEFFPIKAATRVGFDPSKGPTQKLATYGASTQTVRMLFQDYLGSYVFHCHILPHEDAGMMQAITVINNTDSSWLTPADGVSAKYRARGRWTSSVVLADSFEPFELSWRDDEGAIPSRSQAADLNGDFIQDVLISSAGQGKIQIFDGDALLNQGRSVRLSRLRPYPQSALAPWAFMDDVTGDQARDLLTAGFVDEAINLSDLRLKGWTSDGAADQWSMIFKLDPFDFISTKAKSLRPLPGLTSKQLSVATGDFNLDNFTDVAIAYMVEKGVRLVVLDGAALSLSVQTDTFQGGYFPDKALLADALIEHPSVQNASQISLSSGFNQYGQIALENLLLTAPGDHNRSDVFTFQLEAGHFIATGLDPDESFHSGGGHHSSPRTYVGDQYVDNLPSGQGFPLHLTDIQSIQGAGDGPVSVTPVFAGADANGGLFVSGLKQGDQFVIAQGNGFNGVERSSRSLLKSADQLPLSLDQLSSVDLDDVVGIKLKQPNTTVQRQNVVNLVTAAYAGSMTQPSTLSRWVGEAFESDGLTTDQFVDAYLADPVISKAVRQHFDGELATQSVEDIVSTTSKTLWGRRPTPRERDDWSSVVQAGLPKTDLPLAMLQSTDGEDLNRVALMSAATRWSQAQWGFNAAIDGSVGLGLSKDRSVFTSMGKTLFRQGTFETLDRANARFSNLTDSWLDTLSGAHVSDSGFF